MILWYVDLFYDLFYLLDLWLSFGSRETLLVSCEASRVAAIGGDCAV